MRQAGQRLGRFCLRGELGRGAQATVWRAHDERLDREVALKLLTGLDSAQPLDQWLHEARAVSRLAHPHIVPVFDADCFDGQPGLVFELVPGGTLAQLLRQRGALPAREAVALMLGVVDALRAAHAQGIVHRDLKPSNILIDASGRARVMDFGIAARLADRQDDPLVDPHAGCIVGTPGYLSPEAAAGQPPLPQMDVFAAGLVLGELLCGTPLLVAHDVATALRRVLTEDLLLPAQAEGDDRLRTLVQRAVARDPANRFESAASLHDALLQWLAPPEDGPPEASSGHATLDFLLRRMRHKSDFPALTDHVLRIQRMASSDSENLNSLADEILKDVALTQKLLRLVNSTAYRRGGTSVSTISRAVALVGLAGIRNLALSLVLVEHMKDKAHAQRLKEDFLRSMLAGHLAHALSPSARDAEESFLAAMFYNLGKLLTEYYFPDEAAAIRSQLQLQQSAGQSDHGRVHADLLADRAASSVLGLGFEALGVGVARHWGLPESLQRCMRRPDTPPPHQRLPHGPDRQRWLAVAANELANDLWQHGEAALPARLDAVAQRHGAGLGLTLPDLLRATGQARQVLSQMAGAMGLALPAESRGRHLLDVPAAKLNGANDANDPLAQHQLTATVPTPRAAAARAAAGVVATPAANLSAVADLLAAGIHDITDTLAGDSFRLNQVLRMVLETMLRALQFQRVVFCLRDPASNRLTGRFGLGDRAAALSPLFQVPLQWAAGETPDLISGVCLCARDTLIADSRQPAVAQRLPGWFRQQVAAPSFLLLPMQMKSATFALIYADHAQPGGLLVGERELALLRTLRNQAVMAFRQSSQSSQSSPAA